MIKNILFAGKDFPSGEQYFTTALDLGFSSLITKNADDEESDPNPLILPWNRDSIVSAHSLVIQAENSTVSIDAACLIFDSPYFVSAYNEHDTASVQTIVSDLILSYQLLCKALLDRFRSKKHGKLIFVLKPSLSTADAVKKNNENRKYEKLSGPLLSAAQSAFEAFAENTAHSEGLPDKVMLIKAGSESDAEISAFICKKLSAEEDKASQKKTMKDAVKWISVSGKDEGAFNFFKRF